MNRFQCCVSPSTTKAHLHDTSADTGLTLCERTSVVANYRGPLAPVKLCTVCEKKALAELGVERLSPEMIGVSRFSV